MRLIKRVNAIVAAQLDEIVETFEKPERMLKLAIREMETALQTAAESTAKAIAAEKRLRREHADSLARAESWRDRAAQFVKTNDDGNARRALTRKIEHEQLAETLSRNVNWRRSWRGSGPPKRGNNSPRCWGISMRMSRPLDGSSNGPSGSTNWRRKPRREPNCVASRPRRRSAKPRLKPPWKH